MKIFQCTDSFIPIIDGVGRVVKAYAETLSKRDNEVYVVTPTDNTGYRGNLGYEILDFTSFSLSKEMPWKVGLSSLDTHLAERLQWIEGDIVHVHTPGPAGQVGKQIARKKHIPLVGSFHSKYYDDVLKVTRSRVAAKLASNIVADFYKQCDEVWAVSENAAETLREYGYRGKMAVMPNGTDIRTLNTMLIKPVAEKYGIRADVPVFLFVGQINWKKNIRRILEGCALLKTKGYDFQLILAGRGPDEKEIMKYSKQLGLTENLIMTGHLNDSQVLDCLYHLADLFLFPSIYDNAPMVLREAACMKTPSLVIKNSSSAEVIQNGVNGLICEDTNEDFCGVIEKYIELDEEHQKQIGLNASLTIPIPWEGRLIEKIEERYAKIMREASSI